MIKKIILVVLLLMSFTLMAKANNITIEFMSRNELVWAQYKANKAQIESLYKLIASSIEQIKQGKIFIKIQSAATSFDTPDENKQLAFKRSRQLTALLISKYKISEDNFQISNHNTSISNKSDVALISLIANNLPAIKANISTTTIATKSQVANTKTETSNSKVKPTRLTTTKTVEPSINEPEPNIPISTILTNTKPDNKPRNFLKPPLAPKSAQHKYSL